MITLQHSLMTLFANGGNEETFDKEVPHVLLPDAIRRYCGPRQYSHFEVNPKNGDVSWLEYPVNLKELNKEMVDNLPKHLADDIAPCVVGEETMLDAFEEHNSHLPIDEYFGVKKHLVQDRFFDKWLRDNLDFSDKYNDKFAFEGKEYDGVGVRKLIADIENQGLYILAFMNYKAYGITTNQEWFDKHVKAKLDESYSQELSDATYKYMTIPEDIDKMITEHDWSKLRDGLIPLDMYIAFYVSVSGAMSKLDSEKENKNTISEETEEKQKLL